MADLEQYEGNAKKLRSNIETIQSTFDKYGLEVTGTGASFADCLGGHAAKFYIEIAGNPKVVADNLYMKVNVYDEDNQLLGSGSCNKSIDLGSFSGFDTYEVTVISSTIWQEAHKAKVYLANSR